MIQDWTISEILPVPHQNVEVYGLFLIFIGIDYNYVQVIRLV